MFFFLLVWINCSGTVNKLPLLRTPTFLSCQHSAQFKCQHRLRLLVYSSDASMLDNQFVLNTFLSSDKSHPRDNLTHLTNANLSSLSQIILKHWKMCGASDFKLIRSSKAASLCNESITSAAGRLNRHSL